MNKIKRIGIIGAGFSGTALTAELHRHAKRPLEIFLIDKTGSFGAGAAYNTPYDYHLLNVRAKDMSAFEDRPSHFVDWLSNRGLSNTHEQFISRKLYRQYLSDLLKTIQSDQSRNITLHLVPAEVVDLAVDQNQVKLALNDASELFVDKVVLALGNGTPGAFPFPVSDDVSCVMNPWEYDALKQIGKLDPVLIVGTGLSMIDAVLTLHDQHHQGKIYAVSRHGLVPLPHTNTDQPSHLNDQHLPLSLRKLSNYLRGSIATHVENGGDWRSVINALRTRLPAIWSSTSLSDQKRFLRHIFPYWNIHRHRVHDEINQLLSDLSARGQLNILSGRVHAVKQGEASIRLRYQENLSKLNIKWLINCMGPGLNMKSAHPLATSLMENGLATLDPLGLGFDVSHTCNVLEKSGEASSLLYSLGPPTKGVFWEITAVPDIRKQSAGLAKTLLA